MAENRSWEAYAVTYRAREMKILAHWIRAGESGSVVGLVGSGRSNLLGFLCYRPETLKAYLLPQINSVALIPVDLNDLPANDLSTLYRIILRSFDRVGDRVTPSLQRTITQLYQEHKREQDPFVTQSALHELLLLCQAQQVHVVLVMNRFDRFCQMATPQMINTLRSLRDNFKDTLCYIVGMRQEVAYLTKPEALGDMYDILDSHICWVGAMSEADARHVVNQAMPTALEPPPENELEAILALSGNFPDLLKAISQWWLTKPKEILVSDWKPILLEEHSIQYRLARMWDGLTQEEQSVLSEVQKLQLQAESKKDPDEKKFTRAFEGLAKKHPVVLERLGEKGVCVQTKTGWQVNGDLLTQYVAKVEGRGRGRIWMDEHEHIYQGAVLLELAKLEHKLLSFLIRHPQTLHTKTILIDHCWPEETRSIEWEEESLFTLVRQVRRKIEPFPSNPRYLVNWQGYPEGGYRFYPEGRPGLEAKPSASA